MTQMDPSELRERLERGMPDAPSYGVPPSVLERDLAAGQRLLWRRRGVLGFSTLATLAVIVGVAVSLPRFGANAPDQGVRGASSVTSETDLLEYCRTGDTSRRGHKALFGTGRPTVMARARGMRTIVLAIESADGLSWGDCVIDLRKSPVFRSAMAVYHSSDRSRNFSYSSALERCDHSGYCSRFQVSVVDRRDPAVAYVEFVTLDGQATRLKTANGYYAFNYSGILPDGGGPLDARYGYDRRLLNRITFFDEAGAPIAAEALNGSGGGEDGAVVPGLPLIRDFPSLRGNEAF